MGQDKDLAAGGQSGAGSNDSGADAVAVTACRSCGSTRLVPVLDLGSTPVANALLKTADAPERSYPLGIVFCPDCSLVQLGHELAADAIFDESYPYYSSFSDALCRHAQQHAEGLLATRSLGPSNLVVELASNDGYLLRNFVAAGVPVLGIDPSPGPAAAAEKIGVPTMVAFFGDALAKQLRAEGRIADVIIANNVMAHVPDLNDFVAGMATLLADDGLITVENPYVRELIDHVEFDTIYHEHFCYFSCLAVDALMRRHGMFLNDIDFFPNLHGGTLRWSIAKVEQPTDRLREILAEERRIGMDGVGYYSAFADSVRRSSDDLRSLLQRLRSEGATISAYGAAAKGSTLVNTVGVGSETLEYVADRNVHKQGHFMPGVRVPIVDVDAIANRPTDYLLLLAWNFKDEIMQQQAAYAAQGGRFIIPLPEPVIV